MNITLSPELQKRFAEKIERGGSQSADAIVEQALNFYLDDEEGAMDEEELREARSAIDEAIAEGERGEGRPSY